MSNTDNEIIFVPCPICKKSVIWSAESPYRPFCSKRCQLIDLGEWAAEEKRIASEESPFTTEIDEFTGKLQ
ncbi:DNA gyrase inhibitor YacG [Gallibacterium trehalosifermentans]|uniref:DNA gyrase inhibitor YacG n=1 Tax=Gallibacterium trehalosifermentans TaxID=516935 RepID=A0ABV6H172_9PAST